MLDKYITTNNLQAEKLSLRNIVGFAVIILFLSHGTVNSYFPSLSFNLMSLLAIIGLVVLAYGANTKTLPFILIIYICSHFRFLIMWGGLFVLTSFGVLLFFILRSRRFGELKESSSAMNLLVIILILNNLLGWVLKNSVPLDQFIPGVFAFLGYILVFIVSSRFRITPKRIEIILSIFSIMAFYSFLVSINSYFRIFVIETPVIPIFESRKGLNLFAGTFGNTELYGEYGLAMLLFLFPFLFVNKNSFESKIPRNLILVGVISSILNLLMSRSRSVFFIGGIGVLIEMIVLASILKSRRLNIIRYIFGYGVILLIIFIFLWEPLKLSFTVQRFYDDDLAAPIELRTEKNLITGEGTPRDLAFSYFFWRLPQESWWIGYGWGVPTSNRIAWFEDPETPRAGYHSLYLSLPMIYGWVGSVAFISIIILTLLRLRRVLKQGYSYPDLRIVALSSIFMLMFIMINEYKISLMRNETYHMMFWIWLGLSNSVYNTLYSLKRQKLNEGLMV